MGKSMEEHLRFAVCYWHNFCWDGFDIFGSSTFNRPWHGVTNDQAAAEAKLEAAFSFFNKLGNPYFCFHDTDIMAAAETPKEHVENFAAIVGKIEEKMAVSKTKLLWGTANMFSHPRYMAGASTIQIRMLLLLLLCKSSIVSKRHIDWVVADMFYGAEEKVMIQF